MATSNNKSLFVAMGVMFGLPFLTLFAFSGGRSRPARAPAHVSTEILEAAPASRQFDLTRYIELGEKRYPSQEEIKGYLILDARLSVQKGLMTKKEFEEWTGQPY
jgi:hypothetical protein